MSKDYWGPPDDELDKQLNAIDAYLFAISDLNDMNLANIEPSDYILELREDIAKRIRAREVK